jgi:hypothetical protein
MFLLFDLRFMLEVCSVIFLVGMYLEFGIYIFRIAPKIAQNPKWVARS